MRNTGEILQGINKQTACLALRQVYYFLPEINKIHIVKGKTAHGLPAQINISSSELVGELKCHFYTGEEALGILESFRSGSRWGSSNSMWEACMVPACPLLE